VRVEFRLSSLSNRRHGGRIAPRTTEGAPTPGDVVAHHIAVNLSEIRAAIRPSAGRPHSGAPGDPGAPRAVALPHNACGAGPSCSLESTSVLHNEPRFLWFGLTLRREVHSATSAHQPIQMLTKVHQQRARHRRPVPPGRNRRPATGSRYVASRLRGAFPPVSITRAVGGCALIG
jgi:hypothetical protein